jgi:hypothetical protein
MYFVPCPFFPLSLSLCISFSLSLSFYFPAATRRAAFLCHILPAKMFILTSAWEISELSDPGLKPQKARVKEFFSPLSWFSQAFCDNGGNKTTNTGIVIGKYCNTRHRGRMGCYGRLILSSEITPLLWIQHIRLFWNTKC